MIGVHQTTFSVGTGNCFSAALASILELPIEEVPFFMHEPTDEWFARLLAWLKPRGLWALGMNVQEGEQFRWIDKAAGYHILSGQSPFGLHSVVAYGEEIVWDPAPANTGLTTRETVVYLIPLDPARSGVALSRSDVDRLVAKTKEEMERDIDRGIAAIARQTEATCWLCGKPVTNSVIVNGVEIVGCPCVGKHEMVGIVGISSKDLGRCSSCGAVLRECEACGAQQ